MGSVDIPEAKRQVKQKERQAHQDRAVEKRKKKSEEAEEQLRRRALDFEEQLDADDGMQVHMLPSPGDIKTNSVENVAETEPIASTSKKRMKHNTEDISNIALASLRHHTGLRETAEIATAAWIDAGIITREDTTLVIDHNKVKRAHGRVMAKIEASHDEEIKKEGITCILFDGRCDETKVLMTAEESTKQYPAVIREEHYSVCAEPGGSYLFHFAPDKSTDERKHAEVIADELVKWLKEKGADKTLMAIGGDSCNVNTGREGGVMHHVEVKLGRKLVWIVCDLHTGELGLRHLVTALDGRTLSSNKWSGPLGKMLDSATDLEINPNFERIEIGPPLPNLTDEVIRELSTDQSYGYRIVSAIRSGTVPKDLALLQIGPVCHSRWLTTALRFMRIWISIHNIRGKTLKNLKMIVEFCVGVYMVNWFNIKIHSNWSQRPNHQLYLLQLLRQQSVCVLNLVLPTVQRSAWYCHS